MVGVLVTAGVALGDGVGGTGVLLAGRRVAVGVALGVLVGVAVGVSGVAVGVDGVGVGVDGVQAALRNRTMNKRTGAIDR